MKVKEMILLFLYKILTVLASPFIFILLLIRLARHKEDKKRFGERLGLYKVKRPKGKLIWMHGASVGECLSMMPLIEKILNENPKAHIVVTSGTVTSANLMKKRLPERAFHQYIPVDLPWAAWAFVRHFKPDMVLWFESDFWPNLLWYASRKERPVVLLNGRISDKSFARWMNAKWFIKPILQLFTLCMGQTLEDIARLKQLGAVWVDCVGNLKFAAVNPPVDEKELNKLKGQIGDRPCFVAASTHAGEEELMAVCYKNLQKAFENALLVLVPRHPNRADELETMLKGHNVSIARRSRGEQIDENTNVYLADTIGEMGLLYQLGDLVFVGGSLVLFGGQNMLEPMRLGRVVFVGPYAFNFREIVKKASETGALIQVQNVSELMGNLVRFFSHKEEMPVIQKTATAFATSQIEVLDRVYDLLDERIGF